MSDEEGDPEAQGVDALRLLKQGSLGRPNQYLPPPAPSRPDSVPLVPLVAAQKRSRSLSRSLSDEELNQPTSAVPVAALRAASRRLAESPRDRNIRQHRSAPGQSMNLMKELRSCRSAPDLTLPALAAIRGLQNGTLQVDRQTRLKIAAAAKKVLEARELRRRASQEREAQQLSAAAVPDPVSPLALQSQPIWDRHSQGLPASQSSTPQEGLALQEGKNDAEPKTPTVDTPGSLGLATAIASGQAVQGAAPLFHRPALTTSTQGGALITGSRPPFTVTTGLPRFNLDAMAPGENTTADPLADQPMTSRIGGLQREVSTKLLSIGDLFVPSSDKPRGQGSSSRIAGRS